MGLTYMGQRDHGTTRTQGPIGIQEHKPPKDDDDPEKSVERGPAGMAAVATFPGQDTDLRKEKTHVQVAATEPAPDKKTPPPTAPKVAQKKKQSWIEFHVVRKKDDDTEENVPGVDLHVVLPDDNEVEPKTGGNGKKKIEPIDPGTCELKGMKYRRLLEVVSIKTA